MLDHRHPFSKGYLTESTDYKGQLEEIKNVIIKTFPIPSENFRIIEGHHGLYAAILVALTDDNFNIIENAMEKYGFFRSQPTDNKLLLDRKNRKWIDLRFEPKVPDDVN